MNSENLPLQSRVVVRQLEERFEIVKLLGQGTAGTVYHVRDKQRGMANFALKILSNPTAFDRGTLSRFINELKICSRIRHPNIVQAYELVEGSNLVGYTMELIDGCDLRLLLKNTKFSYSEVDQIMHQILEGIIELHRIKILHRDLKLENIMLGRDGVVKISDLGLVKKMERRSDGSSDNLLGTPQYMAPEYIKSTWYDERSEIYACGIILYELLTGKRRLANIKGDDSIKYLMSTRFEIPRISLPAECKKYYDILAYSLAVSPDSRFQSAREMQSAFGLRTAPACREAAAKIPKVLKRRRRSRLLLFIWAVVLSTLAAMICLAVLR